MVILQIAIYNRHNEVITLEHAINPTVSENSVFWDEGSLRDIKLSFVLLEDNIELKEGDILTNDLIAQDKKQQYQKRDLEKENTELKKQITDLSFELMMKGVL